MVPVCIVINGDTAFSLPLPPPPSLPPSYPPFLPFSSIFSLSLLSLLGYRVAGCLHFNICHNKQGNQAGWVILRSTYIAKPRGNGLKIVWPEELALCTEVDHTVSCPSSIILNCSVYMVAFNGLSLHQSHSLQELLTYHDKGLFSARMPMSQKGKERQRNCFRLKTKDTHQQNTTHDPRLNPVLE